jgi:hypothetical protein
MYMFVYDLLKENKHGRFDKTGEAEVSYVVSEKFGVGVKKIMVDGEDKTAHYRNEEPEEFALMEFAARNNYESISEQP